MNDIWRLRNDLYRHKIFRRIYSKRVGYFKRFDRLHDTIYMKTCNLQQIPFKLTVMTFALKIKMPTELF